MFVITEKRLASLVAPITPFYGTGEWLGLENNKLTAFSEIYRTQPQVRAVVDFMAGHLARIPIKLWEQKGAIGDGTAGARKHMSKHPLQKLLSVPNGTRRVGRSNFWNDAWKDFLIYDRVCLAKIRNLETGDPAALVRIPPVWFTPAGRNYWWPEEIRIIGNRGFASFRIEDCVYIHGYDPVDPRIGVSPMTTLKSILDEEAAGQAWRQRFWENNAQQSMVVTRPLDAPDWDDVARDRFIESLRAAASRGKPLMLEEGMTTNPASGFDPKSTQYVQGKEFTREEVLRVYNMPVGLFNPAGSGEIAQYRAMLYQETLLPIGGRFTDELETQLLTEWSDDPYDEGLYLEYAIEEHIQGSMLEQLAIVGPAVGNVAILTRKEGRDMLNLPTLPDNQNADSLVLPSTMVLADATAPEPPTRTVGPAGELVEPGAGPRIPFEPAEEVAGGPRAGTPGGAPDKPANQNGPAKPPEENDTATRQDTGGPARRGGGKARQQSAAERQVKERFVKEVTKTLERFYTRQKKAVMSKKGAAIRDKAAVPAFNKTRWNRELAADLQKERERVSAYYGEKVADDIGGVYDFERTVPYLAAGAAFFSQNQNDIVEEGLLEYPELEKWGELFDNLIDSAEPKAQTEVDHMESFATFEAAKQNGASMMKEWIVTSGNPRPSHESQDGEQVGVEEPFSNGLLYPHDPAGDANETAGCTCEIALVASEEGA